MRHLPSLLVSIILLCLLPISAAAQMQAATLVADSVTLSPNNRLVAQGNVEVFYETTRLSAEQIIYDPESDRLLIEGPILIQTSDGTLFTADRADIDPRLENGLLVSARMILNRQLQLAANQIDRVDGRYTQLTRVAATSCSVCGQEDPLWDIRARHVTHDQQERQLFFDDAVFRIRGLPILWLPRLRLPDPTLDRATGLLLPEMKSSNLLGFGLKLPYFIKLGDHRDLTLTPYFSTSTNTLEFRYRQAYISGGIEINGAVSQDDIRPGETRYYLFADGSFALGNDYNLRFALQNTSDDGYLLDYGYSSKDRLESGVWIERIREDELFSGQLVAFQGLVPLVTNDSTPPILGDVSYEKLYFPSLGGRLGLNGAIESHLRPDADPLERDVFRIGFGADWTNSWHSQTGLLVDYGAGLSFDGYATWDDASTDEWVTRISPSLQARISYPMAKTGENGVAQTIEPIVALSWSEVFGGTPANEDSTRAEFDETNLFALSHFSGEDRSENGLRLAFGGAWTRATKNGTEARVSVGKLWQQNPSDDFTSSSGLDGQMSELLVSGQIRFQNGLFLLGRTLLDEDFSPSKSELRLDWARDGFDLSAAYTWLDADTEEDRPDPVSEWEFDGGYRINNNWSMRMNGRYDIVADAPAEAGLAVNWRNECVTVGLSASRRFTSSINVQPSTDYGLTIGVAGFSTSGTGAAPARHCAN